VTNLNYIARYSNGAWSALANNGLSNFVRALAISGSDLYVGGLFTQTADGAVTNLNHIAKFDTSSNAWSAFANNGISGDAYALAVSGNILYVGGQFGGTFDGMVTSLNCIAKYNTTTNTWSALTNNGLDNAVVALVASGSDLYVGGSFTQTADGTVTNLNYIAKYNTTTNVWSAFANSGLNSLVKALAVSGSNLYVGGSFTTTADSTVTNLNRIAKYNTSTNTWSALANNGLSNTAQALAVSDGILYVGGNFAQTADGAVTNLNRIAKFNTSTNTWSAFPNNGLNITVYALVASGSDLFVGGSFTQTHDGAVTNLNRIARFSTDVWSPLSNNGLDSIVRALAISGNVLFVGGHFTATADGTVSNLNYIARYSNGVWGTFPNQGLNNFVYALAIVGTDLYVGGSFTQTADGSVSNLNRIARFNLTTNKWVALSNHGLSHDVFALAANGSDLYVGGDFIQTADGVVPNLRKIAKYNTTTNAWSALAKNGLNNTVVALAMSGSNLYAGGVFTATGDGTVTNLNRIAKYNTTTSAWSALLNNGLNGTVWSLAVSGSALYVGGDFTTTADGAVTNLNRIAKYTDLAWVALAHNGLDDIVYALVAVGSDLYVGGKFTQNADAAVTNLNRIAMYNTTTNTWSALPNNGLSHYVSCSITSYSFF